VEWHDLPGGEKILTGISTLCNEEAVENALVMGSPKNEAGRRCFASAQDVNLWLNGINSLDGKVRL
jgi:hypothetical protein